MCAELGLDGCLTFAGARRDIPAVMRALDLFVLTSRHEGFGRVVAEAMAAGRPVVVTDEGALPELVDGGADGLCAAPGDAEGFARQIVRLLDDPRLPRALAARAAEAARKFDAGVIADRVWARYQALVARADLGTGSDDEALRPALERGEREQLAPDVLAAEVAVDEALDGAGVEPELVTSGPRGSWARRASAAGSRNQRSTGISKPRLGRFARRKPRRGSSSWRMRRLLRMRPILLAAGSPSPNSTSARSRNGTRTSRLCAIEILSAFMSRLSSSMV